MKATEKIIQYFKENEELFNSCIKELDGYNGYLGDNRYYEMDLLEEFYNGTNAIELLNRAYFGWDEDNYIIDKHGEKHYNSFNPNRNYFSYNGYGNLISTDYIDYSVYLGEYAIEAMSENRYYIDTIDNDDELSRLFDELEEENNVEND